MKWKTKSLVFKLLDIFPFSETTHHFLKRNITRTLPRPESSCNAMIIGAKKIFEMYAANCGNGRSQARFLEIGAGSDLVTAICLRALGVGEIVTTDVNRLARLEYINSAALVVAQTLKVTIPLFNSFEELENYGVTYLPNTKIQDLLDGPEKYDCVYSSDTLEHIGDTELVDIHKKITKLLSEKGVVIHLIDVSDHYARIDPSITRFNFLTFSDKEWKKYNHNDHYVNRLRPAQYKKIFEDLNYNILLNEKDVETDAIPDINAIDDKFKDMNIDEIFALRTRFILQAKQQSQKQT